MTKKFSVPDSDIQHYIMPELTGNIVGMKDEAIRPQTVEEIEAIQKQAYEEARQSGYADGLKQGLAEMQAKAEKLQGVFNFLQHPLKEMDREVEQQLTELSIVLAKQLLQKECKIDEQHILALIHNSLDYLPVKSRGIRVRLNPRDIELLDQSGIDISEQSWACEADKSVTAGGCIIESETSHIDATVEARVQQLIDQLNQHQSGEENDAAE
ncbi:hypothetical protein MNBD_GAMMA09-664 [hydrothermal vent metagenome]|uniref:Flagellar assembly protein FliH/Type III secretion system HrpE domain-containing protein n=1 Tax=hydrothermal vent metagenome TaxID=652676 RepID=A0A3B0XP18_9ZZZZ